MIALIVTGIMSLKTAGGSRKKISVEIRAEIDSSSTMVKQSVLANGPKFIKKTPIFFGPDLLADTLSKKLYSYLKVQEGEVIQMNEQPKIYGAVASIMDEVGAIGKDKRNATQGFMYRGIDDVMNTLHPLFAKHHVFLVPECLEHHREERVKSGGGVLAFTIVKVKYTLYAEDGSCVSAVVFGEGMDSGDKGTNKAMAIAMKYALFQIFCIPTEEMVDPDSESPQLGSVITKVLPPPGGKKPADAPVSDLAAKVDAAIQDVMRPLTPEERKPYSNKIKEICGVLNYRSVTDPVVLNKLYAAFAPKEAA